MTFYVVTGRYYGDDEDTVAIYEAAGQDEAIERMVEDLMIRVTGEIDVEDGDPPADRDEVYILSVVECDTRPRILIKTNW